MPHWTVQLEGGPRRVNHAAICAAHKIFSFGGYCSGEDYEEKRPIDVHVLNTVTLRWTLLPPVKEEECDVPYKRYGHTAVNYDDLAYIWGGRNDSDGACHILFCFDTDTLKWSRPNVRGQVPPARDGHSACVIDHKMYIFGGYEEMVIPENVCRDFHTATAVGSKMYVFGGRSDEGGANFTSREIYDNSMLAFDTVTACWELVTCHSELKPVGRRSHSTFEFNGCLYVFGGYNGLRDQHFSDMYKFDLVTSRWSAVVTYGQGPCARRRQCCCVLGSQVYLFGGTSPKPSRDSVEEPPRRSRSSDLVDHADLHVLDFSPSLKTLCLMTVIAHGLDRSQLPHVLSGAVRTVKLRAPPVYGTTGAVKLAVRWELDSMTRNNTISRALSNG